MIRATWKINMPTCRLPSDPTQTMLDEQAVALHQSALAGDSQSIASVIEFHTRGQAALTDFKLADAQLVLARSYMFTDWPHLQHHLEIISQFTWAPQPDPFPDPHDEFIRLACLTYGPDHFSRRETAKKILTENPAVAHASIYAAATTGNLAPAREFLLRDPSLANTRGGPHHWPPLLYACYSRINLPAHSTFEVARLLLQHGADPNAGFLWRGLHSPFTALTGVFGDGESGPVQQPPHPDCLAFARMLLEAGADPNDSQTLYNRHFRPNNDYLELLFEFGLGTDKGGPWFKRLGSYLPNPTLLLAEEIWAAAKRNYFDRVKLLVEHGVPLNIPGFRNGRTPCEEALLSGNPEIAHYLLQHGAAAPALNEQDRFIAALLGGDANAARTMLEKNAVLISQLGRRAIHLACEAAGNGKLRAIRLMYELGVSLNTTHCASPLHQAAWAGDVEMARLLVELGANPSARDPNHNARPLDWANYNQQRAVAEFLAPITK